MGNLRYRTAQSPLGRQRRGRVSRLEATVVGSADLKELCKTALSQKAQSHYPLNKASVRGFLFLGANQNLIVF